MEKYEEAAMEIIVFMSNDIVTGSDQWELPEGEA